MLKRIALILAAIALLAMFVGCAKAPEAEIAKANQSVEAARAAEAETYVPDSYRAAMDTLNAANAAKTEADGKFALFRSYGKAKNLYVKADEMFTNTASEAATEKERVRVEVTQMLTQAKAAIDSATAALAKAPRGKGSKADIELIKGDLDAASAAYTDAENDINSGKYMAARAKVEAVVQQAHKVINDVAEAAARKAGK